MIDLNKIFDFVNRYKNFIKFYLCLINTQEKTIKKLATGPNYIIGKYKNFTLNKNSIYDLSRFGISLNDK